MTLSDEKLIAFLDGELSQAETESIGSALEASEELANRLHMLAAADKHMQAAFKALDARPIRTETLDMIDEATVSENTPGTKNIHTLGAKTVPQSAANDNSPWMRQAIAAALALAIGFGGGALVFPGTNPQHSTDDGFGYQTAGVIDQNGPLFSVLENTPSTSTIQLNAQNGSTATPLSTFQTKDKGFCREFSVQTTKASSRNIACRAQGNWTIVASVLQPGASTLETNGFIPASESGNRLLDGMILEWIEGDLLGTKDEAKVIAQAWRQE